MICSAGHLMTLILITMVLCTWQISFGLLLNQRRCESVKISHSFLPSTKGDGFLDKPLGVLSKLLEANPLFSLTSKVYSFFYWFPRNNLPYDKPWVLFRNNTVEWLAWYQFPHNLPPYGYLGEGYPPDFFCWGLEGNTLPLGNWDPWGLHHVSAKVVRKYRESELKHGRIAMLACVGFVLQEMFHPLYDGNVGGIAITHMSQLRALRQAGIVHDQVFLPLCRALGTQVPDIDISLDYWSLLIAVGAVESTRLAAKWTRWARNEYNHPFDHNIGIGNLKEANKPEQPLFTTLVAADQRFFVEAELNHGRLAMIAFVGMIGQEYLTGFPVSSFFE